MKILHAVESYYPSKGGMQEVVKRISENLVNQGHDVTVVTKKSKDRTEFTVNGVKIVEFDVTGNYALGLTGDIEGYKTFLLNSNFDIFTNFAAQQFTTDVALPILDQIKGKKVFVPTGFSGLYSSTYTDYFNKLKIWMKSYDANIFLSNDYRDIKFARDNNIENQIIITNGASKEEFLKENKLNIRESLGIKKDSFLILTIGSHTNAKGHTESIELLSKANIKDSVLVINGNKLHGGDSCYKSCIQKVKWFNSAPQRLVDGKRIILTNLERDQLVDLFKSSQLFLFASNVECSPIVLFESMAAKVPFLTSEAGNSPEIVDWSGGGLVMPTNKYDDNGNVHIDIDESTKLLEQLYLDKSLRSTLADNAQKVWLEKFTWEEISNEYLNLYSKLLENKPINFLKYKSSENIKVDVIIPTYNHVDYLISAIKSVEAQTHKPNKIIIVDDGSTDTTQKVMSTYKSDLDIQYIRKENSGLSAARNTGLLNSKAGYVAFLDADDEWYPKKLEEQLKIFTTSGLKNLGLVYCNYSIIDENGDNLPSAYRFEIDPQIRGNVFIKILENNKVSSSGSGVLVKRSVFNKVGDFDTNLNALEDWDMWLRIAKEFDFDYTQKTLSKIRRHSNNMQKDTSRMFTNELKFINAWAQRLPTKMIPLSWEFSIANQIIGRLPEIVFMRLAVEYLAPDTNRKLFKQGYGSMKLYILKRLAAIYKDIFMYNIKELLRFIRNSFTIIFKL